MTLARRARAWPLFMVSALLLLPHVAAGQGIEKPRVPVRTAIDELRGVREEYAAAFNKKDTAKLVGMYATDAILIRGDGVVLTGTDAIRQSLEAGPWMTMSIASDSVRVFGNTALDIGTVRMAGPDGPQAVSHYLVALRRGVTTWKINSLAVVPEAGMAKGDSAGQ